MVSDPCSAVPAVDLEVVVPDPLRGSIRFACRCGVVIDSADYPPRTSHLMPDAYADARKAHADACPMRFDPPWPFDRLPRLASQLVRVVTQNTPEAAATTPGRGDVASGATSRLLSGVPRWIRRRTAIPGFGPSRVGSP